MTKIVFGAHSNLKTVRKLANAYQRAIRTEEAATKLETAWRLAKKSDKALRALRLAQNGETASLPRTARNLGKAGFAALATIGRVIARAVRAQLALVRANVANVAKRAERVAARKVRASLRVAVLAVVALALPATGCDDATNTMETGPDAGQSYTVEALGKAIKLSDSNVDCLIPWSSDDLRTVYNPTVSAGEGPDTRYVWRVYQLGADTKALGEGTYSAREYADNNYDPAITAATWEPCLSVRPHTAGVR